MGAQGDETGDVQEILDEYFDKRVNDSTGDAFLRQFLVRRLWDDDSQGAGAHPDDEDKDERTAQDEDRTRVKAPVADEEDAEFLDQADDFERQYNFRCAAIF
jgi:hypothetical protein